MPPTTTTTKASPMVAVQIQRGRLARQLQRAAQPGQQKRAEREHAGEQPGLVDAERADHLAVLRGGAHQRAPQRRAREQQPQRGQHHRADDDQEQVVAGNAPAEDVDRRPGPARGPSRSSGPRATAPRPDDQHQREGGQQLEQLRRAVDARSSSTSTSAPTRPPPPRARSSSAGQKPMAPPSARPACTQVHASMKNEPCAKLTMRVTPKISDSPAAPGTATTRRPAR